jgi:hypothetical protein
MTYEEDADLVFSVLVSWGGGETESTWYVGH